MGIYYDMDAIAHEEAPTERLHVLLEPQPTPPPHHPTASNPQAVPLAPPIGALASGFHDNRNTGHLSWSYGPVKRHLDMPSLILVDPVPGFWAESWRPATYLDLLAFKRGRYGGVEGKGVGGTAVGFCRADDGEAWIGVGRVTGAFGDVVVVVVQ